MAMLREQGYRGHNFDVLTRLAFDDIVDGLFQQASTDCLEYMLNAEAERRGVSERSLFVGPWPRARRWASAELLAWWAEHGRLTYAEYVTGLLGRDTRGIGTTKLLG